MRRAAATSEKGEGAEGSEAAEGTEGTEATEGTEGTEGTQAVYSTDSGGAGGGTQAAGMGLAFPVTIVTHRSTAQPGQVPKDVSGWRGIGKNCSECAGVLPTGNQNLAFRHAGQCDVIASP